MSTQKPIDKCSQRHYSSNSQRVKATPFSLTDEWIKKMWYTHTMEYYLAIKRNEVFIHARIQINLENTVLNGRNQPQKTTFYVNLLICPEQTNSQRQKIYEWWPGTRGSSWGKMSDCQRVQDFCDNTNIPELESGDDYAILRIQKNKTKPTQLYTF